MLIAQTCKKLQYLTSPPTVDSHGLGRSTRLRFILFTIRSNNSHRVVVIEAKYTGSFANRDIFGLDHVDQVNTLLVRYLSVCSFLVTFDVVAHCNVHKNFDIIDQSATKSYYLLI